MGAITLLHFDNLGMSVLLIKVGLNVSHDARSRPNSRFSLLLQL